MSDAIGSMLIFVPALPLLAAIATAVLGPRLLGKMSHVPTIFALGLAFVCSLLLLSRVNSLQKDLAGGETFEHVVRVWTWSNVDGALESSGESSAVPQGFTRDLRIGITLRADALTAVMLAMVTFVSTLVAVFAAGYMKGDRGYWRFFSYLSLFVFSMTMLVSASNLLLLFVFWEAVGLCSYLLIGFWYQKPEAAAAGKKAFLVNRVGDAGFILAMFLIWTTYGTLNFHSDEAETAAFKQTTQKQSVDTEDEPRTAGLFSTERVQTRDYVAGGIGLAICLLLMLAACGKSAQFPLHIWLPDAMEGPTPVSALIHAATMVTAGVYMVARCAPLFTVSPDAQLVVAVIGGFTALLAALIALTQFDLKRVLAYSTISQLGYMFLALGTGVGGVPAAMFHLLTHAFFKALLFLGSGSVMHAMGNVIDMRRIGGLRKVLPVTHGTFLIGCLALAGIVPFAGFWSKDAVLASVHDRAHELSRTTESHPLPSSPSDLPRPESTELVSVGTKAVVFEWLYWVAVFTAFLTAFYTFRAFYMTFYGEREIPDEAEGHAHESPGIMCIPLIALAFCAAIVGVIGFGIDQLSFFGRVPSLSMLDRGETEFHFNVAAVSTFVALAGIGLASYLYLGDRKEIDGIVNRLKRLPVSPYQLSQRKFYIDELYQAAVVLPLRGLAWACYWFDRLFIDGLVNTVGRIPPVFGTLMRGMQLGLVPFYALAMAVGVLILIAARILWAGN